MKRFHKFDTGAAGIAVACTLAACAITLGALPTAAQNMRTTSAPLYLGYAGKTWDQDYGVADGRCNRQAVGSVLGVSGVRGDKDHARSVATLKGQMTNAGNGPAVDDKDRICIGYALELAGIERGVVWTNTDSGVAYRVIPLGGFNELGKSCREFLTRMTASGQNETFRHKACSAGDGVWQIIG